MDLYDLSQYQKCYVPPSKQASPRSFIPTPPDSPKSRKSCSSSRTSRSGRSKSSKPISPPMPFDDMHEAILVIIEEVVEKQMAKAMLSLKVQSEDFDGQNETLNQQLGLHHQSIQRQNDIFDSQTKVLNSLLATTSGMIQSLAETPMNLQQAISQAAQEETQRTINQLLRHQHQNFQDNLPNQSWPPCLLPGGSVPVHNSSCHSIYSSPSTDCGQVPTSFHSGQKSSCQMAKATTFRRRAWMKLKHIW
ncbi:hypothetical protein VHEMI00654 [[Torrubiella] hemipterigena]|uniref:Uncharacterized protein n=1 Tax=[Torrubiella] hemipterigena TaxID=1531966 RepID=A0A0A1T556_9HYPO|nr:hypothetical protein VHEMI00654 [[Torrubiella] hemipterigena]